MAYNRLCLNPIDDSLDAIFTASRVVERKGRGCA